MTAQPPFSPARPTGDASGSALAGLDRRSREIFKRIVDQYLETGEPVGSRNIAFPAQWDPKLGIHVT